MSVITNSPILPLLQAQGGPRAGLKTQPNTNAKSSKQGKSLGQAWHLAGVRVEGAPAARMQEKNGQHHHHYQQCPPFALKGEEEELCLALEGRGEIGRVTLL